MTFQPEHSHTEFPWLWDERRPSRIGLLPRDGDVSRLQWFEAPRCFAFHFANAYDDGDLTIIDLPKHPSMFRTDQNGPNEGAPILVRWTLNRPSGRLTETVLDDRGNEFPRINGRHGGQAYRYLYTAHWGDDVAFGPAMKHDLQRGTTEVHDYGRGPDDVGARLRAQARRRRRGRRLDHVLRLRPERDLSDVVILDAQDFAGEPIATIRLPVRVPFGFHGGWAPDMNRHRRLSSQPRRSPAWSTICSTQHAAACILGAGAVAILGARPQAHRATRQEIQMATFTTRDDVTIYYKDWGPRDGKVVILSHGWPLNADSWESQAFHLASNGYRVIAHDRRGHGRSSQPWDGNDMDHYADDLAQLIERLDLRNVSLFGFSTGGGEVARYVGRHGTSRVARIGLISAVPPIMLRTESNPIGLPIEVFDGFRAASIANRSKLYRDVASGPFFGFNRPGATLDQGLVENFWLQGMTAGHKNTYDCIAAFSATDFTQDLKRFDKPTLVIHGDDDQVVPIDASARSVKRLRAERAA